MKIRQIIPFCFLLLGALHSDINYAHYLEAPYPPEPLYDSCCEETEACLESIQSIDDVADFELGKSGSLQRDRQEYNRRLISEIDSAEQFYRLREIDGYLITFSKSETIARKVQKSIKAIFDQSLRRIYYAGYGCETLEETLCDHEELQSAIAKYYPNGIPLDLGRLSQYCKALACGYRKNYIQKIEKLRDERLTIVDVSSDEPSDLIKLGVNPVRIVLNKETQKPLAVWKAGSDKFFGKIILMALGGNEKLYELESANIEMGFIATWNELLAQVVNFLYRGRFHTPMVTRFGDTTLHAYHRNEGALSKFFRTGAEDFDAFIGSLDTSHVQHWAILQFLMSSGDSHRGNTLVDGKHLILIDFGRALGLAHPMTTFQIRSSALEFPQMTLPLSPSTIQEFGVDSTVWFRQFVEGIEKFEERKVVRRFILKAVDHLQKNLITLRQAVKRDLTPFQMFRLKYPPISLEDHLTLEELFKTTFGKEIYSEDAKDREFRKVLNLSGIFREAPFMKAFVGGEHDHAIFEFLIEKELDIIQNTPTDELFTELQLSWLIKASMIIPLKYKPVF